MINRKVLGKGLDALIPDFESGVPDNSTGGITEIYLHDVIPNQHQPRKYFDPEKINDLIESIREKGVIQPIVVQKKAKGYEIIAGERRWRASKAVGLKKIPAVIKKQVNDLESIEIAIIENIQRQDLNPIEEAQAYYSLANDFSLTQEQIAKRVGKSRTAIANFIRLLKLPRKVQEDIIANRLSMGHARALLGLPSEKKIEVVRQMIVKNDLNVRKTEALVKSFLGINAGASRNNILPKSVFLKNFEVEMERILGTKVEILSSKQGGRVVLNYYSDEDLERLLNLFKNS